MYGRVLQSQAPGALIAHNLGTATFCAFLIQDRTAGGVALPAQDAWIDTKAAGTFTLNDNTPGGPGVYSIYVCTPHSVLDAGPIVTAFGAATSTRTAALTRRSAAPSYRSLHSNVAFVNGAGSPGDDVTIVHNLGTTSVLVFVSPTSSTVDTGAAGLDARVFLQAIVDLNTITLRSRKDTAANFVGASPGTWDVMVVAAPTVGHSKVYPPHLATGAGGVGIGNPSYDYSGADLARVTRRSPTPSYWAGYSNVDTLGLVGAAPVDLVHNLGGAALMALVGGPSTAASPGLMIPYIQARDQGALGTTIRLAEIGAAGPLNNNQVLVIRSHSQVNLQ